jgi:hypothetical protein
MMNGSTWVFALLGALGLHLMVRRNLIQAPELVSTATMPDRVPRARARVSDRSLQRGTCLAASFQRADDKEW